MLHWDRPVLKQPNEPIEFVHSVTAAPDTMKGPAVSWARVITAHSALDNNCLMNRDTDACTHTNTGWDSITQT